MKSIRRIWCMARYGGHQLVWAVRGATPTAWERWFPTSSKHQLPDGVSCERCGLYISDVRSTHG